MRPPAAARDSRGQRVKGRFIDQQRDGGKDAACRDMMLQRLENC
jgi:hypothetical protein